MRSFFASAALIAALSGCLATTSDAPEPPLAGEALLAAVEHRKIKVYREDGYAVLRIYRDRTASWQNPRGWQFTAPWRVEGERFCLDEPEMGGCWRLRETASFYYKATRDSDGLTLEWCDMKGIDQVANQRCTEFE